MHDTKYETFSNRNVDIFSDEHINAYFSIVLS